MKESGGMPDDQQAELAERKREWREDCLAVYGCILTGAKAHRCPDWDFLPIDETTPEMDACLCFTEEDETRLDP